MNGGINLDDKQIDQIAKDIIGNIDSELKLKSEIKEMARVASFKLVTHERKVYVTIKDKPYLINAVRRMIDKREVIDIVIADPVAVKKTQNYRPFLVQGEVDNNLSYNENLTATIESFLRHAYGLTEAAELDALTV